MVLAHDNSVWLSGTNAMLKRIDLTCDMLAPAAVGLFVTAVPVQYLALIIATMNVISVCLEYWSMTWLYAYDHALATRAGESDISYRSTVLSVIPCPESQPTFVVHREGEWPSR